MNMNKTPVTYEGDITLRRFFRALKRNFLTIVSFFLLFCLIGVGYLKLTTKQRYTSTGYVTTEINISGSAYQNIANIVISDECIETAVNTLEEKEVKHANGTAITFEDIYYGLSATALDTLRVRCVYTASDSTVVQTILDTIMEEAVAIGNSDAHDSLYRKSLIVLTRATAPSKIANNTLMKGALFAFVGLALGVAAAIIRENARDTIYTAIDFDELGVVMFPVRYQNDTKLFKSSRSGEQALANLEQDEKLQESLVLMQNHLSVYSDKASIQTVALVTPRKVTDFSHFAKAFVQMYAKEDKTLLIDLNAHEPTLDQLFPAEHDKSLASIKDGAISLSSLAVHAEENVDVIYTEKMAYPHELYRSTAFQSLLEEAKKTYKHIVFLSPAWMDYQDLASIRDHVDAVLLFASKNKTRRDDIVQSIQNFDILELPYIGTAFLR